MLPDDLWVSEKGFGTLKNGRVFNRKSFAQHVGTNGHVIGRYERDEIKPLIEVASKIADALEVSLDFLLGKTMMELNKKTLKRLQDIQKLNEKDR